MRIEVNQQCGNLLGELVVGLDQFLGLFLVFLDFFPIRCLGFVGEYAEVGQDVDRVLALVLYAERVGAFDGDVDEAVFLCGGAEDVAHAVPEAFLLGFRHADDGVFRYGGDHDFFFRFRRDVVVDGAVELGQGVEVVELARQLITKSSLVVDEPFYLVHHLNVVFADFKAYE